jgi:CO dehydrogenase maturation factor
MVGLSTNDRMRIAIIGKGGSGKSSVSWLLAQKLSTQGTGKVLAIDADYNMDLAHNLGIDPSSLPLLKTAEKSLYARFNLPLEANAFEILKENRVETFDAFAPDAFTDAFATDISDRLKLMVLGDHDEETMYSGRCSHAYAKAIKFYLPYLNTKPGEYVIIDSVAGTDMVNYGLYLGVDAIVCVAENTKNSLAVMRSARTIAADFGIPFFFVMNKAEAPHADLLNGDAPIACFANDVALATCDYARVSERNLAEAEKVISRLSGEVRVTSTIHRLAAWKTRHDGRMTP